MANYPQNTHYMQQQQQQHQQQMNQQRALYMQQHGMHQMPDGSIRSNMPPQQMMMMSHPGQRPPPQHMQQQRMMLMTSQPTSQAQQQQHMQMQQQQHQQRAMAMNQQQRQMMQANMGAQQQQQQQQPQQMYSQYSSTPPPRGGMTPSPMKLPPQQQQQLQMKPEGMRTPIHMGQPMIIRTTSGGFDPNSSQPLILQQQPQQIATSSSSQSYVLRPTTQGQQAQQIQIRPQQQGQFIRTGGVTVQRIIRPQDMEMAPGSQQYVIRTSAPPQGYAYAIPSSTGEQQYQIIQQPANFVQASGPGQTIRTIRQIQQQPSQQQQTPLRMALAQPSQQGNIVMSNLGQPVLVVQGTSSGDGGTQMIIDGNVIATSSTGISQPTIVTTTPIQTKQTPPPPAAQKQPQPTVVASIPAAKPATSKPSSKKPASKSHSKSKSGTSSSQPPAAPAAVSPPISTIKKSTEPVATILTPQAKIINVESFERMLRSIGLKDSLEPSVKHAIGEYAESYAEMLVTEIIESARLRKVNKIENRDAKFVISREQNKDKDLIDKKK